MHFSAKRGIAIACRLSVCPSVCLSVTLVNCDHTVSQKKLCHFYFYCNFDNKVKLRWEIFYSCYEPFLSDSDIERILKIDQHLPKLQ